MALRDLNLITFPFSLGSPTAVDLSASLSGNILKDKGIDATLQLANSPNTKVIVVGSDGSDGLPMILGGN